MTSLLSVCTSGGGGGGRWFEVCEHTAECGTSGGVWRFKVCTM